MSFSWIYISTAFTILLIDAAVSVQINVRSKYSDRIDKKNI